MAKDKSGSFGQQSFVGQELPGDDLSGDFDPLQHEASQMDLDQLDAQIEQEIIKGESAGDQAEQSGKAPPPQDPDEPSELEQQVAAEDGDEEDTTETETVEPQEAAEETTEEAETEEVADPGDERLSALERQLERQALEREKDRAEAEKWRLVAERESARAGNLQHQAQRPQQPQDEYTVHETQAPQQVPQQQTETQTLMEELNIRAMEDEQRTFLETTGKFMESLEDQNGAKDAFSQDIQVGLKEHGPELQDVLVRGRPKAAARMAKHVFASVLADARLKHMDRQDSAARAMKEQQRSTMRAKKKAASGSPGKSAGRAAAKPKFDPLTVNLDDFDRALDQQYGTNKDLGDELL